MALRLHGHCCAAASSYERRHKISGQFSGDNEDTPPVPAQQFRPLVSTFQRRLLVGVGSATLVAVGANFAGITSFILGASPELARKLKLDLLYPVGGYSRYIQSNEGFEFMYPSRWAGDQTLLIRAAKRAEQQRNLALPPLDDSSPRVRSLNEPVIAFGPPGSTGELNVSVVVSPVPPDFRIEAFGGPEDVGKAVLRTITGQGRPDIKASLLRATLRTDPIKEVNYYEIEFKTEGQSFKRHNVAVCCARKARLYTLNAQAPESSWPEVRDDFYFISNSFNLTSDPAQ